MVARTRHQQATPTTFGLKVAGWAAPLARHRTRLAELRPRYRLACLSNSNALHWEQNRALGVPDLLDACFSSHELGLYKPDRAVFDAVLGALDAAPERVVFFDDNQVNVDGGAAAGLVSHRVAGIPELRGLLVRQGLLEPGR